MKSKNKPSKRDYLAPQSNEVFQQLQLSDDKPFADMIDKFQRSITTYLSTYSRFNHCEWIL